VLYEITSRTLWKDLSRPSRKGDEFIEIGWGEVPAGFELHVVRGKFQESDFAKHLRKFQTRDELKKAVEEYIDAALKEGFKSKPPPVSEQ
jgi:hypothetical protein